MAFAVAGILSASTYAFTASNTVPTSKAGSGSGAISGYTVSSVVYNLNSSNPTNIDSVTFSLDAAATVAKIKLVAAGSTYYSCTNPSGYNWSCGTTSPQASVSSADELQVTAVS